MKQKIKDSVSIKYAVVNKQYSGIYEIYRNLLVGID